MSFARNVYSATEEQTDFTISFPYISNTHVRVFQNGIEQDQGASAEWTIVSGTIVRFNTAADISEGDVIVVRRSTSQETRIVDWETGTTLTEDDLDNDSLQAFYMVQEAIDAAATALGVNANDLWDATGVRLTEVGTPTASADAATKEYVDDAIAGISVAAGNVPVTTEANDGYLLTSHEETYTWDALEATGAQIEDAAVDTEHLADAAVTLAKIDPTGGTNDQVLKNVGGTSVTWADATAGTSGFSTGDMKPTIKTAADSGWILLDDGTIGNAASGASNRADADTEALFLLLWANISDTYAPVTGGRGASAAADFAANKKIQVGTFLGRAMGAAGTGSSLTARALGEIMGAEQHTLTSAQSGVAAHLHGAGTLKTQLNSDASVLLRNAGSNGIAPPGAEGSFKVQVVDLSGTNFNVVNSTANHVGANAASAHNNMQPTSFVNWMMKL